MTTKVIKLPQVLTRGAGTYELHQLRPLIGTWWRHFKGGLYQVTGFSLGADELSPLVTYAGRSPGGPIPYTRTWAEFTQELFDYAWQDEAGTWHSYSGLRFSPADAPGPSSPPGVS